MISTTSTASTPICSPQLPPEMVMNAGALQPFAVRQVATPLPPLPPKTKPPLTMCGITATHFACSNTSSGIPLSGIPMISCITEVALSSRSVASSRADAAQHSVPRPNIASTNTIVFMEQSSFLLTLHSPARCYVWRTNPGRHSEAADKPSLPKRPQNPLHHLAQRSSAALLRTVTCTLAPAFNWTSSPFLSVSVFSLRICSYG